MSVALVTSAEGDHATAIVDGQTHDSHAAVDGLDLSDGLGGGLGWLEVLDVGCGTGVVSFAALEQGAARVTAEDVSTLMLERTREKAAAYGA